VIVQPDFIPREHYLQAGEQFKRKKDPPGFSVSVGEVLTDQFS
jgi:hypothetical protein